MKVLSLVQSQDVLAACLPFPLLLWSCSAHLQLKLSSLPTQVAGSSVLTWSSSDTALTKNVDVHLYCAPAGGLLTVQLLADSNVAMAVNSSAITMQLPMPKFITGAVQVWQQARAWWHIRAV